MFHLNAEFTEVPPKFGWISINAISAGAAQLILGIAAGQDTNADR